jgi:plastocyanin domain-containing protein
MKQNAASSRSWSAFVVGAPATSAKPGSVDVQVANIAVTEKGFEPDKIRLPARVLARLTFVRTTDKHAGPRSWSPRCTKRALPLNEPVVIEVTPAKSGDIAFACSMDKLKGVVVVE